MTKTKKPGLIDWILLIAALICLAAAICPFSVYRSAADGLASDGNMESLTPERAIILRVVFAGASVFFLGLFAWGIRAGAGRRRFFRSLAALPGRCFRDISPFFRDLGAAFSPKRSGFWLFLLIFIAGTLLRLLRLNDPLMHDEAYSMAIWGRSDLLFAISDYHLPNNHVFHSFLVNLIYHHLGHSVALLRLPVFLSGSLLIVMVWLLGRLFYNDFVGLTAAGLTAFAPFLVFYSVNARGYEMQAFLSVMTVGLAVYAKRRKNIFAWLLLILISALNFFTLPIALYPFGGICIWLFLNVIFFREASSVWRSRWQLFKYLIFMGLCVSLLSMLLYVPLLRYSGWNSFFGNIYIGGVDADAFPVTMLSRLTDNVHAFIDTLPRVVVWIITAGICASVFVFRRTSRERISYGLSLLLWMTLVIPFQKPNLWPRTLLFLHPFLLMFAASGLSALRLIPSWGKAAGWICAALVAAAGVSQFLPVRDTVGKIGLDERAVRIILDREGDNAGNIHFVTAAQDNAPLWIYADAYGLPGKIFDKRETFNTVYAFVNPLNDSWQGPQTLDDLLDRFSPGGNFIDMDSAEILMEEDSGVLYRFEGREGAIRKAYGEYPEK